jgi:hypothetical protein
LFDSNKNAETETGSKSVQNWLHKSQPFWIGTPTSKLFNNYPLQIENEKNIGDFFRDFACIDLMNTDVARLTTL